MSETRQITPPDWMRAADTGALFDALEGDGAAVRFVGGCVRDAVLGVDVTDLDVATDAIPGRVLDVLRAHDIRVAPTGIDHGTVTAIPHGRPFQVTTLRRDVETDGRRAVVTYTTDWAEDAERRDFTINALSATRDGTVHDYVGGLPDLAAGRVRFIGSAADRIAEDYLRILRFFRFHAGYARTPPDHEALAACAAAAARVESLSGERIWLELSRILVVADPEPVFTLMHETGVLEKLLPVRVSIPRLQALASLEGMTGTPPSAVRRLAALVEPARRDAARLATRLRLSRADTAMLDELTGERGQSGPAMEPRLLRRALYRVGADHFRDLVLVDWAHAIVRDPNGAIDAVRGWKETFDEVAQWTQPELPVTGADVMAMGVPEGPGVGDHLRTVEEWWIDRGFQPDREACLARLRLDVRRR